MTSLPDISQFVGSGGEIKMWLKFENRSDHIIETDSTQESQSPDMSVSMKFLDAREILGWK